MRRDEHVQRGRQRAQQRRLRAHLLAKRGEGGDLRAQRLGDPVAVHKVPDGRRLPIFGGHRVYEQRRHRADDRRVQQGAEGDEDGGDGRLGGRERHDVSEADGGDGHEHPVERAHVRDEEVDLCVGARDVGRPQVDGVIREPRVRPGRQLLLPRAVLAHAKPQPHAGAPVADDEHHEAEESHTADLVRRRREPQPALVHELGDLGEPRAGVPQPHEAREDGERQPRGDGRGEVACELDGHAAEDVDEERTEALEAREARVLALHRGALLEPR